MFAGEDPTAAALRGTREELATVLDTAASPRVLGAPLETTEERESASSYPKLLCRYAFYEVGVEVNGLPLAPFETIEGDGELRRIHHWRWQAAAV